MAPLRSSLRCRAERLRVPCASGSLTGRDGLSKEERAAFPDGSEEGEAWQAVNRAKGTRAGRTYHYRIRCGGAVSEGCTFRTAPPADAGASFTFAVIGDVEGHAAGSPPFARLSEALAERDLAFFVVLGDLVYYGQQQSNWDGFFRLGAPLFRRIVFVPVIGDHSMERLMSPGGEPRIVREPPLLYLDQFLLPDNGTAESYTLGRRSHRGLWYSFDYGSAHVACIENTGELTPPFLQRSGELQRQWLDSDLAGTTRSWRFLLGHRVLYPLPVREAAPGPGEGGTVHVRLPKLGTHYPKERTPAGWQVMAPGEGEERIPAIITLVTVSPERVEVVSYAWTQERAYHSFVLTDGQPAAGGP